MPTPPEAGAWNWRHPEFKRGVSDMAGVAPGIAAWGLVTGVAMTQVGLPLPLALAMSLLVFAGSAQLAALPLIASGAPVWVVLMTTACVNLRFVILSAQWRPYLAPYPLAQRLRMSYFAADLNFAFFMQRFPAPRAEPAQVPYFWGGTSLNWLSWQIPSVVGILFAESIPSTWGIGFAGVLALLGLTCSMLHDRATAVAAAVAGCAAVAAYALPLKLNIVVAIAAAVAIALLLDHGKPRPAMPAEDNT